MENQIIQILTATGLAALIGLEREMHMQRNKHEDYFGGVRTFAMLGTLGALSSIISENFAFLSGGMVFFLITISYAISSFKKKNVGLTTDISGFASFMIGILVVRDLTVLAITISILFTSILALRTNLHKFAKSFEKIELYAILKFLIISAVVLPLAPNEYVDPWDIFNPHHVWLMVIFVAAIRFVAFFLGKIVGSRKSIVFTGLIGGLASSTAVTSALSDESCKNKGNVSPFVAGILFANMLMFFRVIVEVAVVNSQMITSILLPLSGMGVTAGLFGLLAIFYRNKNLNLKNKPKISQPFSLSEALKFGAFFVMVSAAAKFVPDFFGNSGLLVTGAVSGLADTDAITLTMANAVKNGELEMSMGVATIVLAVMVNTLVKMAIIAIFGSRQLLKACASAFAIIFSVGIALLFLV